MNDLSIEFIHALIDRFTRDGKCAIETTQVYVAFTICDGKRLSRAEIEEQFEYERTRVEERTGLKIEKIGNELEDFVKLMTLNYNLEHLDEQISEGDVVDDFLTNTLVRFSMFIGLKCFFDRKLYMILHYNMAKHDSESVADMVRTRMHVYGKELPSYEEAAYEFLKYLILKDMNFINLDDDDAECEKEKIVMRDSHDVCAIFYNKINNGISPNPFILRGKSNIDRIFETSGKNYDHVTIFTRWHAITLRDIKNIEIYHTGLKELQSLSQTFPLNVTINNWDTIRTCTVTFDTLTITNTRFTEYPDEYTIGVRANKIILPDSVTAIGNGCFFMTKIKSLILPPNLKTIGVNFAMHSDIETIVIPSSVTHIGDGFLLDSTSIRNIRMSKIAKDSLSVNDKIRLRDIITVTKDMEW